MTDLQYTVRVMKKEDVPQVLDLWIETEFQEGTQSVYTWLAVDPEAFNVAVTNSGEILGVCSAIIHHEDLAFVGMYAVREKYRGLGIGFKIWNACMNHIGSINACLNAIPEKFEAYRDRDGFPIVETKWTSIINETKGDGTVTPEVLSDTVPIGVNIQPFQESHLKSIFEYDFALMGYNRNLALELNFKEQDSQTLVAFKDGACVGFGTIKLSVQKIGQVGPLYADDPAVAEVILRRLIVGFPHGRGFSMMTCSSNAPANDFIKRLGCPKHEECPRLYRKKKYDIDLNKVFGQFDLSFSPY